MNHFSNHNQSSEQVFPNQTMTDIVLNDVETLCEIRDLLSRAFGFSDRYLLPLVCQSDSNRNSETVVTNNG